MLLIITFLIRIFGGSTIMPLGVGVVLLLFTGLAAVIVLGIHRESLVRS